MHTRILSVQKQTIQKQVKNHYSVLRSNNEMPTDWQNVTFFDGKCARKVDTFVTACESVTRKSS